MIPIPTLASDPFMSESGEMCSRPVRRAEIGCNIPSMAIALGDRSTFRGAERAGEPASGRTRVSSVDIVRGAIMVLMALDHVRDFVTNQRVRPEDLTRSSAALFATRWVTHFCAPGFSFLAGLGLGLYLQRGRTSREASRFLVTRGLWLVVLDLTVSAIGFQFGFRLIPAFALVLWALGWSMIFLALAVHLPRSVVAALALAIIAGHSLLDGVRPDQLGAFAPLWTSLHVPGFVIPGVL